MTNEEIETQRPEGRGKWHLVAIVTIAALSLGGSYLLFFVSKTSGGWGTTNHGAFVTPAQTVRDLDWRDNLGQTLEAGPHWWLWQVDLGCGDACVQRQKNLRALHVLLNRESERVRRGFTDLAGASTAQLEAQFPDVVSIAMASVAIDTGVYIIDPLGNLVLFYPPATEPKLILEDLKKLLKVSQIG